MRGEYIDHSRSHHHTGALLWVGSSRNWSVFLERPYHGMPRKGSGSLSMQPVVLHGAPRTLLLLCRHMGDLGRIWLGDMGMEGRIVGHCEILEGMCERVGSGESLGGLIKWW